MEFFGSGAVLHTTDSIETHATRLAEQSSHFRSCGIVIANMTEHNLTLPHRYISTGKLISAPLNISEGTTGLILCENRPLLLEGSCGLLTYKIENPNSTLQQLQILWWVPLDLNLNSCKVNVRVGIESASEDIFQSMYTGVTGYGSMTMAADSPLTFTSLNYEIDVTMGCNGKAPLSVYLKTLKKN